MAWYWPTIEDESSAQHATKAAVGVSGFIAAVTALIAILSMVYRKPILGLDAWGLIDAVIFGWIAWRISKLSRAWAIVWLLMYLLEVGYKLVTNPSGALGVLHNYFYPDLHQRDSRSVRLSPIPEGREPARTTRTISLEFADASFCLLSNPVRPDRRVPARNQRRLAQHRIHKIFHHRIMQIGVRRKLFPSTGIDQFRPVQRTHFHLPSSAADAAFVAPHLGMPAHVHDPAYAICIVNHDGGIVFDVIVVNRVREMS
jgi:hypothetical protein